MKEFWCGVIMAGGLALFGKSMYELGKDKGRKDTLTLFELVAAMKNSDKKNAKEES